MTSQTSYTKRLTVPSAVVAPALWRSAFYDRWMPPAEDHHTLAHGRET